MPKKIDVIGRRFGRMTVTSQAPHAAGRRRVECRCDCGMVKAVDPRELLRGSLQSCGCLHRQVMADKMRSRATHGKSRTRTYNSWLAMKSRCHTPADPKYADYGGRGIIVCDEWACDFERFLAEMGERPIGTTLDRIDVNGPYSPENCRWATVKVQARNKRHHRYVTHDGKSMPLSQACEATGVNYRSALYRLNRGVGWMPRPPAPTDTGRE